MGIQPHSGPVHSQYHSQDKYGQYVYGYASGLSAADEIKTADGVTRGGYSYIDAHGILQTVQYVSDHNGFRVSATNIPRDVPAVAIARAQHLQAYENIKAEHAYISALQAHGPVHISPIPAAGTVVVPISAAHLSPATPVVHHTAVPVALSSQFHAQDRLGQYSYGYAGPLSSKTESKTADGVTRGGYSYIDANGVLQSVQYISDPIHGFRVQATNLPEAPAVTLIGPKVTTNVVGPKDDSVLARPGINEASVAIVPPPVHDVPELAYKDDTVLTQTGINEASLAVLPALHGEPPLLHNPAVGGQSGIEFANPVIGTEIAYQNALPASPSAVPTGNVFINPNIPGPVAVQDHPIIPQGNNPVVSEPLLTNPIQTVPFVSNGKIASHTNLNLLVSQASPARIDSVNPPVAVPTYAQRELVAQSPQYQPHQQQHYVNLAQNEHFQNLPINTAVPYQQAVLPDHAISKDLINSGPINVDVGLSAGPYDRGSIAGPALFAPRQHAQQVPQSPVNVEQQAPYQQPAGPYETVSAVQHQPDIRGPTGYYTQNTQY